MRSRRAIMWSVVAVVLFAVVGVVAAVRHAAPATTGDDIPTTTVKRGDLEMKTYADGELRASKTETIVAPPIGGGALQITHVLRTGTPVKKGDLVIEFDPTEQHYKMEQSRSELLQAEQEITKAKADADVAAAKDKVDLLKARYDVRKAELKVQTNELSSTIDAHKNDLALDQAKRALQELEQDIKSRAVSGQATIALAEEKRNKAKLSMEDAQTNIGKMRVTSPMDGLVALDKNESAFGDFGWALGGALPEYREGDQVDAGRTIGKVIDPAEMELTAKVGELERNSVRPGQTADIKLNALPGETLHGTVKNVGASNNRMFWEADSGAQFEVTITLDQKDARLRPGLTAKIVINGDPRKNVLYVPRQALFLKESKRLLYVRNGNSYDPREVKIVAENESRAAIEGVLPETEVALVDPTAPKKATNSSGGAPAGAGGPQ